MAVQTDARKVAKLDANKYRGLDRERSSTSTARVSSRRLTTRNSASAKQDLLPDSSAGMSRHRPMGLLLRPASMALAYYRDARLPCSASPRSKPSASRRAKDDLPPVARRCFALGLPNGT